MDSTDVIVHVEEDAPPFAAMIAGSLRDRLGDADFRRRTVELAGVGGLRARTTPQAVTLRVGGGAVSLAHGIAEDADVTVTVDLENDDAEPEIAGGEGHEPLVEWLFALLELPTLDVRRAAERYWAVLHRMTGAPEHLTICDARGEQLAAFGAPGGFSYEIHGDSEPLLAVLCGRLPIVEAAARGLVFVRGSLPQLSVMTGAGFMLMLGDESDE